LGAEGSGESWPLDKVLDKSFFEWYIFRNEVSLKKTFKTGPARPGRVLEMSYGFIKDFSEKSTARFRLAETGFFIRCA